MERDLLKSGVIQALPYRDSSGRRIMAIFGNFGTGHQTVRILYHWYQRLSYGEPPNILCLLLSDSKDKSAAILFTSYVRRRGNAKAGMRLLILAIRSCVHCQSRVKPYSASCSYPIQLLALFDLRYASVS